MQTVVQAGKVCCHSFRHNPTKSAAHENNHLAFFLARPPDSGPRHAPQHQIQHQAVTGALKEKQNSLITVDMKSSLSLMLRGYEGCSSAYGWELERREVGPGVPRSQAAALFCVFPLPNLMATS